MAGFVCLFVSLLTRKSRFLLKSLMPQYFEIFYCNSVLWVFGCAGELLISSFHSDNSVKNAISHSFVQGYNAEKEGVFEEGH